MNLGQLYLGEEAIDYQGTSSKFANDLIVFFQDIIDKRDNEFSKLSKLDAMVSTREYFNEKKLIAILNKHTGFSYNLFLYKKRLSFMFATIIGADNNIYRSFSSMFMFKARDKKKPKTFAKHLDILKSNFDKKTGMLKDKGGKQKLFNPKITMYFCLDTAFLTQYYDKKNSMLTAGEIAAIVLHEVGHNVTFIDRMGKLHRTLNVLSEPVSINIKSFKDLKQTGKNVNQLLDMVDGNVPSKQSAVFRSVITTLEESAKDDRFKRFNIVLFILAAFIYMCVVTIWTSARAGRLVRIAWGATMKQNAIIKSVFSNLLGTNQSQLYDLVVGNQEKKDSDFKHVLVDGTDVEFEADKFATMHGVGPLLVSGLDKMYTIMTSSAKITTRFGTATSIGLSAHYACIKALIEFNTSDIDYESHGKSKERNRQIGKTLLSILRANNIPKEVEQEILLQYKYFLVEAERAQKHQTTGRNRYKTFQKIINKILTLNGLLGFIVNGKVDQDYLAVMEAARDLANNELIYTRKRLEQLV